MRVLITGGAGFIGSHLVDRLSQLDQIYIGVIDNFDNFYDRSVKEQNIAYHMDKDYFDLYDIDIRDNKALEEVLKSGWDVVVHLAAKAGVRPSLEDPALYADVNINGTINILEMCKKHNVPKMVFASSSSVYGNSKDIPFKETAEVLHPISPYAATKVAGELLCHTYSHLYGIEIVALRIFTAYGPRQRPDLAIHKFTKQILNNEPITVFGDGLMKRDFTYIDDLIDGIMAAMDYRVRPLTGSDPVYDVFNLGESECHTISSIVEELEKQLGVKAKINWQPQQPGDVDQTYADISKARKQLGYNPHSDIKEGIEKFIHWYKTH